MSNLKKLSDAATQGEWGQFGLSAGKWQKEAGEVRKRKEYGKLDTSHDVSAVVGGVPSRVGTFQHAATAEFVENLVNAYRAGDLVEKDALQAENERLREVVSNLAEGYGPNHLSKFVRDTAIKALIADTEDKP